MVRFNADARAAYLRVAQSAEAPWSGNCRDLAASVTRLATLAEGGRIGVALVEAKIARLRWLWQRAALADDADAIDLKALLGAEREAALDLFDRLQLQAVQAVVRVCRESRSLSDAGRRLFQASRAQRGTGCASIWGSLG